jgi:hypothetical protein
VYENRRSVHSTHLSVDPEAEIEYKYKHESLVKSAKYESLQSIKCGIRRRGSSCLPAIELSRINSLLKKYAATTPSATYMISAA